MLSNPNSAGNVAESSAQPYVYPTAGGSAAGAGATPSRANSSTLEQLFANNLQAAEPDGPPPITEEQIRAREARAHKQGRDEGLAQAQAEFEKKLAAEKQAFLQAVRNSAQERETYFQQVEAEVVALAVAIARKILHREAQVDPLLLAGVVRVGLDHIAGGTHVRLRVPPGQVPAWRQFFSQQSDLRSLPELIGDGTLEAGRCLLETELGTADLTLESQLKEIEQGFFDLLAQRPKGSDK